MLIPMARTLSILILNSLPDTKSKISIMQLCRFTKRQQVISEDNFQSTSTQNFQTLTPVVKQLESLLLNLLYCIGNIRKTLLPLSNGPNIFFQTNSRRFSNSILKLQICSSSEIKEHCRCWNPKVKAKCQMVL